MRPILPVLILCALTVSACARLAESRLNPLNWFGASAPVQNVDAAGNLKPLVEPGQIAQVLDGRVLADTIESLEIARTPDGALVTATAVASLQGGFNAQLVPVSTDGGRLTLAFRVELPRDAATVGPAATRRITAARVLSAAELAGIRSIRVEGRTNAREARR